MKPTPLVAIKIINETNPDYESCAVCIHADDSEEACILRKCFHAFGNLLHDCYEKRDPRTGKWIHHKSPDKQHTGILECPFCGWEEVDIEQLKFCARCGARMEEE